MKKLVLASLALAIAGCGPSEQEIQARIDKAVAQKVETLKAEMKAERAAEKAAQLEAVAAAEAKRDAEEKRKRRESSDKIFKKIEAAKEACSNKKDYTQCKYSNNDNYHTFRIGAWNQEYSELVKFILEDPLDLPPNVLSKLEATTIGMGLQEESMEGADVSWDLNARRSTAMKNHVFWSITFNVIIKN